MAPEAIFDCPTNKPDVANWSFTQSHVYSGSSAGTDASVRNGFVSVGAVANQGINPQYGPEVGYYSVYRSSKNEIVVANFNQADFSWNYSSLGPTWDGRLKPDIAAPGSGAMFPRSQMTDITLDIDSIELLAANSQTWSFNGTTPNWQGGWGGDTWWGNQNLGPITPNIEGLTAALRAPVPAAYHTQNRPLLGTLTAPNGTMPLSINGTAGDQIRIRYRLPPMPEWADAIMSFQWSNDYLNFKRWGKDFRVIADGQWQTATIDIGSDPNWVGMDGIQLLFFRVHGPLMRAPFYGSTGYFGAGGSSASAPVVAGAIALCMIRS